MGLKLSFLIGLRYCSNVNSFTKIYDIDGNGMFYQENHLIISQIRVFVCGKNNFQDLLRTQWIDFKTSWMEYFTNGNDEIWKKLQAAEIQNCLFGDNYREKDLLVIETTSHYSSSSTTNQESLASSISSRENHSRALLSLDKLLTFESHVCK